MPSLRSRIASITAAALALLASATPSAAAVIVGEPPEEAIIPVQYRLNLEHDFRPFGKCQSGFSLVPCNQTFSNLTNPIEGFRVGNWGRVAVFAEGRDEHVRAHAGSLAEFGYGLGGSLFKAWLASDGQRVTRDCVPIDSGGQVCFQASAWAFPVALETSMRDFIHVSIPSVYDGQLVNLALEVPYEAQGDGSSAGEFTVRVGGINGNVSAHDAFGNLNVFGEQWAVDDKFFLVVPVRPQGSSVHDVYVPFQFLASLRSSTLNGPGTLDARNSVGLELSSLPGVTFSSHTGNLDGVLTVSAVPEPSTVLLMLAGIGLCSIHLRSMRQRPGRQTEGLAASS